MADEILIPTKIDVDYKQAEKDLLSIQRKLDKLTDKREITLKLRDETSDRAFSLRDQLLTAQREYEEAMTNMQNRYGRETFAPPSVKASLEAQRQNIKDIQSEFNSAEKAVNRYDAALNKGGLEMEQMEAKAQDIRTQMVTRPIQGPGREAMLAGESTSKMNQAAKSADNMSKSMKRASGHTRTFGMHLRDLVKGAFVFNIISMGLRAVRSWFSQVIQANDATSNALANFKGSLMTMIQPLVNTLLPIITTMLNVLTKVVSTIATVLSVLFGASFQASVAGAKALNESVNGTADGFGSANENAKKLQRTLAGFDELTILEENGDTSSGSGGGGSVSAPSAAWDFANSFDFGDFFDASEMEAIRQLGEIIRSIFSEIWSVIKDIVIMIIEWAKAMDFTPLLQAIGRLFESIWAVLKPMLETFKKVWEKFIGPLLQKFVEKWLPRIIDSFSLVNEALAKVNEAMEPIIAMLAEILEPIMEILFEIITKIIEILNGSFGKVLEIIAKVLEKIAPILQWILEVLGPIVEIILTVIEVVLELSDTLNDTLMFILKLIIDLITGDMDAAKEDFNEYMGEMGEHLGKFKELFGGLAEKAKAAWEGIKNAATKAWEGIKGVWSTVKTWFQNTVINPLVNAWHTATQKIKDFFTNIWSGIKRIVAGALNGVISGLESAINWCVSAINGLISGINWVIRSIGKVFGKNWGGIGQLSYVSLGRIPAYAQGGVIPPNREFLAMLGDNKTEPEVVSPLSTMKQAMIEAMKEAGFNGTITVNTFLDGRKVAESTSKYQLQASRAMGV